MTEEQVREIVEDSLLIPNATTEPADFDDKVDTIVERLIAAGLIPPRPAELDPSIPVPQAGSPRISQKVDEEIRAERERQRSQWGDTRTHDVGLPNARWIEKIDVQLDKSMEESLKMNVGYYNSDSYRNRLVKIAALCVAGLEAMDVKNDGGPTRM